MPTPTRIVSADQLLALRSSVGRCELINGELFRVKPAGSEHGDVTIRLTWRLAQYVEESQLGKVFAAETGFLIGRNPDTVRAPDVAFVRQHRLEQAGKVVGYWPGAPDIAVEVLSANDSQSDVRAKARAWLRAGVTVVWVVDPNLKNVTEHRTAAHIQVLSGRDRLTAEDLLGDWSLPVDILFR